MERVLEGDLQHFEVPDLLTLLSLAGRTGVLSLERKDQETKLFLRGGRPVFANSTKEELRFGGTLIRLGRAQRETVESCLEKKSASGRRLGQVLLAEKVVTEAELAALLKVQVSEVIFETFAWPEGHFIFWDGVPPPSNVVLLDVDLQNLLMEGARRIDARARLPQVFPDRDMAVEAVANPERVKHWATLTPEEWQVFFLLDGRRSLSEICRLAGNPDETATLQILWNLLRARLVMLVPPPSEEPSAAVPAPAPVSAAPERAPADPSLPPSAASPTPTPSPVPSTGVPARPGPTPETPVSVEFAASPRGRKVEDDTRNIVTPKAIQYLANARTVTVSRLVLVQDGAETSFPLTRDTYTIGRHRNNDIVVGDPKVSSFHARIDRKPEGFVLVDLKSRNGSFVNNRRIEMAVLRTNDEVRLGAARLIYKIDYTTS